MPHAGVTAPVSSAALSADVAPAGEPRDAAATALERMLRDEPTSFSFFQAVRLLTQLWPNRAPVGRWANPADEVVRFSASVSLAFPPSEIRSLDWPREEPHDGAGDGASSPGGRPDRHTPPRMTVNFIGLTGPQAVLPHVYTEYAAARDRSGDRAFHDFLDLFHHRAISLFYRAWEKHRAVAVQELHGEDRLREHLLDVGGLGTSGLRDRLPMQDDVMAFYAGLFASGTRSADGLARLIGDYFGVPATVEQFAGAWRRVDATGQSTLDGGGDGGRLGLGVIGGEAWDPHSGVRLRLGPLTRQQFDAFLPGGAAHEALRALTRLYVDDQVGVDAQLVLARDEVPQCRLGSSGAGAAGAPALGRGTWLSSRPVARDPDDVVLRVCE